MQIGQLIAGEFMLQKPLIQGAAGEVWRALESNVGRIVRLYFVPQILMDDRDAAERFRCHFEAVRQFRHPHVLTPERLVEQSDGGTFVVSRHVDGLLLNEYATQWIRAEGKFPFNLIFDVLRPVASALEEAGQQNLVHRTLSPRQITVSQTEGVLVLDFDLPGIVREFMEKDDPQRMFDDRERLRYVAPELLLGKPGSPLSDQYSFAMTVAELLGNRLLFPATDPRELRRQILTMQPAKLPGYPEHVNIALQRALYKDPDFRFPTCLHFLDALAGLIEVSLPPPYVVPRKVAQSAAVTDTRNGSSEPVDVPSDLPKVEDPFENDGLPGVDTPADDVPSEHVAPFKRIASAARSATADRVATQIRRERRFRTFFYFWNVLLLVACVVAFFLFRDHITAVWRQRVDGETVEQEEVENGADKAERRARRQAAEERLAQRTRKERKEKEVTFEDEGESPFAGVAGKPEDATDEVRFLGTTGKGKRVLFVVDASAVMGSGRHTPWEHVQKELAFSFKDLNSSQKFQVIYYNEQPNLLPGGDGGEDGGGAWLPVDPETLKKSYDLLKGLGGSGMGNPASALEKAISLKPDVIFFLSDRNSTALTNREIERLHSSHGGAAASIPINAVEIGEGDQPQQKSPIQSLALAFHGEYKWVNGNFHGLKR